MPPRVIDLECPGCGHPITTDTTVCPQCFRQIVITTFNQIHDVPPMGVMKQAKTYDDLMRSDPDSKTLKLSAAFCYLKMGTYSKAIPYFEEALDGNFDNGDAYFYAAVALLEGKNAFKAQRPTINRIIEYINTANMIEPKGIYYYFLAYIKYDYFKRHHLNNKPLYEECLQNAMRIGVSAADVETLYELMKVDRPSVL